MSLVLLVSGIVYGHGGGQDSQGGHFNRKTNEYHCHKESCVVTHRKAKSALHEAKKEGRAFSSLYNRKDWPHWVDADGDCQNARAEALIVASIKPVKFKRNKGCVVSHGQWLDPYSGKSFFKASNLDIDHIVPLKEAHISGGDVWTKKQRRRFANDPENLIVVSARENREKGAKDPAKWLPDIVEFRCEYAQRWVAVKTKYKLVMDAKELAALDTVRSNCK